MSETKAMCEVCGHKHRIVPACRRCGFDGACKGCMRLHNAECPRSGLPDRNSPELASYAGALDAMQASALRALDDADTCADTASIDAQCAVDQPAAWQAELRDLSEQLTASCREVDPASTDEMIEQAHAADVVEGETEAKEQIVTAPQAPTEAGTNP